MLVLLFKLLSSGEIVDWVVFDDCLSVGQGVDMVLKIVIFDDVDYDWVCDVVVCYFDLLLYL